MKKTICILLILSLLLGLSLLLVGCDGNEDIKYYEVTIIYGQTRTTFSFEGEKPMGNNFTFRGKKASEFHFYTDKSCTITWNLVTDVVNCDMTLYAVKG